MDKFYLWLQLIILTILCAILTNVVVYNIMHITLIPYVGNLGLDKGYFFFVFCINLIFIGFWFLTLIQLIFEYSRGKSKL